MTTLAIPKDAVGLRLARITSNERLILCEEVRFSRGWAAVETVLRRAKISGRVEIEGKIENHFADMVDFEGDIVGTVALDSGSYNVLKNRWMRCRVQQDGERYKTDSGPIQCGYGIGTSHQCKAEIPNDKMKTMKTAGWGWILQPDPGLGEDSDGYIPGYFYACADHRQYSEGCVLLDPVTGEVPVEEEAHDC